MDYDESLTPKTNRRLDLSRFQPAVQRAVSGWWGLACLRGLAPGWGGGLRGPPLAACFWLFWWPPRPQFSCADGSTAAIPFRDVASASVVQWLYRAVPDPATFAPVSSMDVGPGRAFLFGDRAYRAMPCARPIASFQGMITGRNIRARPTSGLGHFRPICDVQTMSASPPTPDISLRHSETTRWATSGRRNRMRPYILSNPSTRTSVHAESRLIFGMSDE
jgi:hypothetical protein